MRSPVILRVFKDSSLVEVKQFDADQIVIGHQAEVQLDLPDDKVSPIHCMIELRDAGYYVCDLGSQGGTFKNGQAVLDEVLTSGDEIQVGPFKIVFYVGVPKPKTVPLVTETPAGRPQEMPPVAVVVPVVAPVVAVVPEIPVSKPPPEKFELPKERPPVEAAPPAPAENKKKNKSAFVAPVKPAIRAAGVSSGFSKKKRGPTYAPPGQGTDLREHLKPGKGNVVEVVVAWQDRIIETFHFSKRGTYKVGPTDRDPIRVASSSIPRNWTLLDIGSAVKVNVSDAMIFELASASQNRRNMDECLSTGKAQRQGTATSIRLDQNEMICLSLGEDSLLIFIRFVPAAPIVPMLSPLGLTGAELSGLTMALVLTGLLAFYISATTPKDLYETPQEDVTRTAQIIFNTPPPKPPAPPEQKTPPPPPPEQKPPPPPPPDKAKVADAQKDAAKKGQDASKTSKANEKAGQAAEVAPIPNSQNRPKKFTSTKSGGAVKLGQTAGANANSAKDMSKVGLFSAFGGGGVRSKLDQAYSGSGEVLGQADKATGTSGFNENRAGDDLGSKFKDTGAGGKGTATQGISGIGTKGRGSGQAAYGASDGLGAKTSVAVEAGGAEEDFVGTIDREAVRRRVRHYLHEIRGCYNRELNKVGKGERLEGKVVISWEIIAKGVAKNVRVKSSTLGNANVENCIRERLASWSFPEPPVGMTAEVSFPFYLRPEN